MSKFYYLSSCSTCKRIIEELNIPEDVSMIDIKKDPITENDLKELYALTGSYEALFNKRARLLRDLKLKTDELGETDYKRLLLEHYTFLKRPILYLEDSLFIGNSKQTVANAKSILIQRS